MDIFSSSLFSGGQTRHPCSVSQRCPRETNQIKVLIFGASGETIARWCRSIEIRSLSWGWRVWGK